MNLIIIPTKEGKQFLSPENIIRVQGLDNYSKIYFTTGRPLVVSKVLLWVEERLPKEMFVRVHRSHLVNKMHVKEISGVKCKRLLLINGEFISISRRKRNLFPCFFKESFLETF